MDLSKFSIHAAVPSEFRDLYTLESEKLESLYSKSKRHQWNAETDVCWGDFDPTADIRDRSTDFLFQLNCVNELSDRDQTALWRGMNIFLISQVLHGEQAALMTCGQLVNCVPDLEGKFAAAVQVMDEARHVEVFARYLDCQGERYPMDPDLRWIVESLLSEQDWEVKCVGMQIILESIALSFFRLGEKSAIEPVFKNFIGRVHEDESRHVAYGVLSLEGRIPELAAATRIRLENWAYDAVARLAGRAGKPAFASQFDALATIGIDLTNFLPKLIAETNDPSHVDASKLEDPMAQTVIPNLMRVGLVPERLVPGYRAQGFDVDLAENQIHDLHSWHPKTKEMRAEFARDNVDFSQASEVSRFATSDAP